MLLTFLYIFLKTCILKSVLIHIKIAKIVHFLCTLYPASRNDNILYNQRTVIKSRRLTLVQYCQLRTSFGFCQFLCTLTPCAWVCLSVCLIVFQWNFIFSIDFICILALYLWYMLQIFFPICHLSFDFSYGVFLKITTLSI